VNRLAHGDAADVCAALADYRAALLGRHRIAPADLQALQARAQSLAAITAGGWMGGG